MTQKFPVYPPDRAITLEEYADGYELEKREYLKIQREIRNFLARLNISIEEVTEGKQVYFRFVKPRIPDTLDEYIKFQEFVRQSTLYYPTNDQPK